MSDVTRRSRWWVNFSLISLTFGLFFSSSYHPVSSQSPADSAGVARSSAPQSPDGEGGAQQAGKSAEREEQDRAALDFDLLKRVPEGETDLDAARYQAARSHVCRMLQSAGVINRAFDRAGNPPTQGGWKKLGPYNFGVNPQASSAMTDPCALGGGDEVRRLLDPDAGGVRFYHGGVYPDGSAYLGGTAGHGTLRGSDADGGNWRELLGGVGGFVGVNPADQEIIYVAQPRLALKKSVDGGRTFADAANGIDDTGLFITPGVLDPGDAQRLWTGGRTLWRSLNGAEQWTRASALLAGTGDSRVSAIAVSAVNSDRVLAGTSEGYIHRTDAGLTAGADTGWPFARPRSGFISAVTFDLHNPDTAYATYSTFGGTHVWRSTDGGATWAGIDGVGGASLPDIPVHSLVVDPDNTSRLYVGTDLGVFVSLNGGQDWVPEDAGFGHAATESLVLHRTSGAATLYAFTRGSGVWRLVLEPVQTCAYSIGDNPRDSFDVSGGTGNVSVTTSDDCAWTATSNASWITITTGAGPTGAGLVQYRVAANPESASRVGTMTVAGLNFTVEQPGTGGACTVATINAGQTITGTLKAADCVSRVRTGGAFYASRYSFTATEGNLVAISLASSDFDPYLSLQSPAEIVIAQHGPGGGNNARIPTGSGYFRLPANGTYTVEVTTFLPERVGNFSLSLFIASSACGNNTLSSGGAFFEESGGSGSVNVASANGCPWTVEDIPNWVTITSGRLGAGNLPVNYMVAANTANESRRATLVIAGQNFVVEQAGMGGSCNAVPITPGQLVNGNLSQADCRMRRSSFDTSVADYYSFTAITGQQIAVSAASQAITPQLSLIDLNGSVLAQNRLRLPAGNGYFTIPATGAYLIEVLRDTSAFSSAQIGSYTLVLAILPAGCGYTLTPSRQTSELAGGTGDFNVAAAGGCVWTAISQADWITLTTASGSGSGTGSFTVAVNTSDRSRLGTVNVAGQTFTVEQAGMGGSCAPASLTSGQTALGSITPADCQSHYRSSNFGAAFGADRYSFSAAAGEQIQISATLSSSFGTAVTLADANGTLLAQDNRRIPSSGASFTAPASGTYFIEVAVELVNIFLDIPYTLSLNVTPPGCDYTVAPPQQFFEASGGAGSLSVTAGQGCGWMASSSVDWITFNSSSGSGNGAASFVVDANTGNTARRGTINLAGQTATIAQSGVDGSCNETPITPGQTVSGTLTAADCRARARSDDAPSSADRYSFSGAAGEQVLITATASPGVGVELYLSDANGMVLDSGSLRLPSTGDFVSLPTTGTYFIEVDRQLPGSGLSYTLTLLVTPPGCGFAIVPVIQTLGADGGTGSIAVTAGQGCPWMVSNTPSWIAITSGASGSGNGTVNFTVAPNATAGRRRALLGISGQIFAVEQAGTGGSCGVIPITPGQVLNTSLSASDCQSNLQFFTNVVTERYSFNAAAGDQVAVLALTTGFTTKTLTLIDPTGSAFASVGGSRLPASGFFTLPSGGTYFIEISSGSVSDTESFNYTLSLLLVPANCVFEVTTASQAFDAGGGAGSINVTAGQGCPWSVVNVENWITINSGASGSASGAVSFTVAANTGETTRRATLYVAGQTVTIDQAGTGGSCLVTPITIGQTINSSLSRADCRSRFRTDFFVDYPAERYSFNFTPGQQLAISLTTPADPSSFTPIIYLSDATGALIAQGGLRLPASGFLTLPAGGTYVIEVTSERPFFFSNDNISYTLSLSTPTTCAYSLLPAVQRFDAGGGTGSIAVVAGAGCAWTALSNVGWMTITAGASGSGNGTVSFSVATNTLSTTRSGAVMIAGQSVTIEQAGNGGNCVVMPLTPGPTVFGTLTEADCRRVLVQPISTLFIDRYSFTATAGDQVYASLVGLTLPGPFGGTFSPQFNLIAPNGQAITRSSSLTDNNFLLSLPLSGTYLIEVTESDIGDYALSLSLAPGRCGFLVTPPSRIFEFGGGSGSFSVTAAQGCPWSTAVNFATDWVTINSGASGSGNGAVNFTIAPYIGSDTSPRFTNLVIAGQSVGIHQLAAGGTCAVNPINYGQTVTATLNAADCRSTVNSSNASVQRYSFSGAAGDRVALLMTAEFSPRLRLLDSNGAVVAEAIGARLPAHAGFINLPFSGNYVIEVAAASFFNTGRYSLSLLGPAIGCSYTVSSASRSFEVAGGTGAINITTGQGCVWAAQSNVSWITVNTAGGSGNGIVNFTVARNPSVSVRQGTLNVAGQSLSVEQAGVSGMCSPMPIMPGQPVFGTINQADCQSRDRYFFNGMAGQQASISAALFPSVGSFGAMLSLIGPGGATLAQSTASQGSNLVRLPAAGGFLSLPADGTYLIELAGSQFSGGDYRVNFHLAPAACRYAITSSGQSFEATGGTGSVIVNTDSGCAWDATSNVSWLTITAGGSGAGNGTVSFSVAANTGNLARTGTLTVAGLTFTVEQAGTGGTCSILPLTPGQPVTGAFSDGDCRSRATTGIEIVDRYSFSGAAGDQIVLHAFATAQNSPFGLTTVLYLFDPSGFLIATAPGSRLPQEGGLFRLPATGAYLVEIGPSSTGTTGTYQLSLTVVRPGCGFTLSPIIHRFTSGGGTGSFIVTAAGGCEWTATSDASWITIDSSARGSGNGTVSFTAAANPTSRVRTGRILLAGLEVAIEEGGAGGNCALTPITPGTPVIGSLSEADCRSLLVPSSIFVSSFTADGYSFSAAAGDRAVISVTPSNSSSLGVRLIGPDGVALAQGVGRIPGNNGAYVLPAGGTYVIEVYGNANNFAQNYTLSLNLSSACSLAVAPTTLTLSGIGGIGTIAVTGTSACDWIAVSNADWLSFAATTSLGSGSGTVSFSAAANPSIAPRSTTLSVAGQTVSVTQAGALAQVSSASFTGGELAAESLVSAYGVGLATMTQVADVPRTTLGGTTLRVRDSAGMTRDALLFFVSPGQINYQLPPGTVPGPAAVFITSGDGQIVTGAVQIAPVAPGLFAANADGRGVAAASVLRVRADGSRQFEPVARFDQAQNRFVTVPIDLGPETDEVFLILFGTGIRFRSSLSTVATTIGGVNTTAIFAGPQPDFIGLDQINLRLVRSLAGRGEVDIALTVDGKTANIVGINIR